MSVRYPNASLSPEKARQIRCLRRDNGTSVRDLAKMYQVGTETIRRVLRGDTWNLIAEDGAGWTPAADAPPLTEDFVKASEERMKKLLETNQTENGK